MVGTVRVLVVDSSKLMAWLVGAVAPDMIDVRHASSLAEAREELTARPPHAAMLHLTHAHVHWQELADLCRNHKPPIPFRCFSAFPAPTQQPGDAGATCGLVRDLPRSLEELRAEVEDLVRLASEAGSGSEATAATCRAGDPGAD